MAGRTTAGRKKSTNKVDEAATKPVTKCGSCNQIVDDNTDALECDMCHFWHHATNYGQHKQRPFLVLQKMPSMRKQAYRRASTP